MHHNIKKEKCELNILSQNIGSRNAGYINRSVNVQRPDTLEIKVKSDNTVNLISKAETYLESVSSWSGDNFDNFILQIKNVNNTPSPITPNSFFNPSDVTQDQEQFADALTLHLNKIKEDYRSGNECVDSPYLGNIIQISSINQEKPIPIATVSVGNKVFLLNQINHSIDTNDNQCLNYGLMDIPGNVSLTSENPKTIIHQPLQISQLHSLRSNISQQAIFCSGQNLQFSSYAPRENNDITHLVPITSDSGQLGHQQNIYKSSEGIIYTRVPDSSQTELLNNLTTNISCINPNVIQVAKIQDQQCFSASSNDNDSSYGTNDSSVKTRLKDASSNGSRLHLPEDKELDDVQRRLERKRARNRDAARKCRDRKNSLITTLEQKYAKQSAEKELIRDKLLKSLEEIRRLTEYISQHDPHSKFSNFSNFLSEIKIHELTEADLKDLNLL